MLDIILRPLKDIVVDPLILGLKYLKVSPNVFTMLSGLCGKDFVALLYIYRSHWSLLFDTAVAMGIVSDVSVDKVARWNRWCIRKSN